MRVSTVTYLCQSGHVGVKRGRAGGVCAVGCVAHGGIESCPYWAEDVARGVQRGLLQGAVCSLRCACYT